ncbi:MAG TPA: dienelactone hydrolase family protein [Thermoanaerobaculia bacterium]|nr:dienelactone hydrolase family protein [Thermoanaerobaculia bacterium]
MGEKVTFPSNEHTCEGWLAIPPAKRGPTVVVIQEWWGLVPHIQDVTERFAAEGFLALAPDLYHGRTTKSPDEASRLLMELDAERAVDEILGAGEWLLTRPECSSSRFGVVGFCMGGALAQAAATRGEKAGAAVSFYGGFKKVKIDWESLRAPLLLIYAEQDRGVPPSRGIELEKTLRAMGKTADAVVYPDVGHGFFNDTRPEVYDRKAAEDAWRRTIAWFRQHLR